MNRRQNNVLAAIGFLCPNLLGFLVFTAGPVLFSMIVSFSNWNLQKTIPFQWIGFDNYIQLFGDESFWLYLVNTGYFMLDIPFAIAGSLFLAIMLTQKLKGILVYRTLFYLPHFTAGVAIMILWKVMYNPEYGPINGVLNWFFQTIGFDGYEAPQWLMSTTNLLGLTPETLGISSEQFGLGAREAIQFMALWGAVGGNSMLLYIAALSNIPQDLYEAAEIDGANKWKQFIHITWPQLRPTTFFILIMSIIGGLQGGFEQAKVMTDGGPAGSTTTLGFYIYTKAFEEFQIGYASAVSWVLFLLIGAVTILNWKFGNQNKD